MGGVGDARNRRESAVGRKGREVKTANQTRGGGGGELGAWEGNYLK